MLTAIGRDHPDGLREFGEQPHSSWYLNDLERAVLGALRRDRGGRATGRADTVRRGMLILLESVGPEHGIFLRRLDGIVLTHDRLVDPVGALEHAPRVVRVIAATQIGMAVRGTCRRATWLQDLHLVEIAGDLDRRLGALRGWCGRR